MLSVNNEDSRVQMSWWLMSWEILCGRECLQKARIKKMYWERGRSGGFCQIAGVSEAGETAAVQRRNYLGGGGVS